MKSTSFDLTPKLISRKVAKIAYIASAQLRKRPNKSAVNYASVHATFLFHGGYNSEQGFQMSGAQQSDSLHF